jgi:thiamine phosphate synthase YjbQ (UPF0047 family)
MSVVTRNFIVATTGKGTYEITDKIEALLCESKIKNGIVTIFRAAHQLQLDCDGEC